MSAVRAEIKRVFERCLARAGRRRLLGRWGDTRRVVLAYHNVVPDDWIVRGDRSLHLSIRRFRAHLELLEELTEVRPLDDLVQNPTVEQRRPWVAITFDDAYAGALTLGRQEVVRRGFDATVFVAPGLLGREFWWDILAAALGPAFDAGLRHRALSELHGDQRSILERFAPSGSGESLPNFAKAATESLLREALSHPAITSAPHGWSHRNLSSLGTAELEIELTRSATWLADHSPGSRPYLAYPYGLYSKTVAKYARTTGYRACFRVDGGGWKGAASRFFSLPRVNVPRDLSDRGLLLRLAGLR